MAKMALQAEQVRMPTSENKQYGFTLIELLIVILIVGILASFSVYSVNLVNRNNQHNLVTQLKNQIQATQHKAQMFNFSMRIRVIENENNSTQQIVTERFDNVGQKWISDNQISPSSEDRVVMYETIMIEPNGFITDNQVCINDECVDVAQK